VGCLFFSCCVEEGGCGVHGAEVCFGCSWDAGEGALIEHSFVSDRKVGIGKGERRLITVMRV
jgi:hypothetical protein